MGRKTVQVLFLFGALVLFFSFLRQGPIETSTSSPLSHQAPDSQTQGQKPVIDQDQIDSTNLDPMSAVGTDPVFYGYCPDANQPTRPIARPSLAHLLNKQPLGLMDQDEQKELGPVFHNAIRGAQKALSQKKNRQALRIALDAWQQTQHTLGAVLVAYIATRIGDRKNARRALVAAHQEIPTQRNIALALALQLRHTEHIRQASQILDVYLQSAPKDIAMHQLQARLTLQWELQKKTPEIPTSQDHSIDASYDRCQPR